jgi:hypothetical protein
LIEESSVLDSVKNDMHLYNEQMDECICRMKNMLREDRLHLLNVFRADNEEDSADIELAILTALFNCKMTVLIHLLILE